MQEGIDKRPRNRYTVNRKRALQADGCPQLKITEVTVSLETGRLLLLYQLYKYSNRNINYH